MKKTLALILLLSTFFSKAQNYHCLQSGVQHYFINGNGYLRGIRIDSAKAIGGGDTVLYPFKTERLATFPLDTSQGSWLGSHVMQKADGTFLFNTVWNDTVVIKTQANAGDAWTFYDDISSQHYTASVVSSDTMTILGVSDSIKRIRITSYNGSVINTADSLNNFEIILSKHYGFVQVFDLYMFPYHTPDTAVYPPLSDPYLSYIGYLSSFNYIFSMVSYHNPTQLEIYNFDAGDAFFTNIQRAQTGAYEVLSNIDVYDSIISKSLPDAYHVQYQIHEWSYRTDYHPGVEIHYFDTVTVPFTVDTSLLIDLTEMPEEKATKDTIYFYKPHDTTHCYTSAFYSFSWTPSFEGCPFSKNYKGGFEQDSSTAFDFLGTTNYTGCYAITTSSLTFSIKNGMYCGPYPTPPDRINEVVKANHCTVFPNPASNKLTITATYRIHLVCISNTIGQMLYSHEYDSNKAEVDIADLPNGIYFVRINNTEVRKFVKE